ncbi:MAG: PIN domain-containing protein [Terriglobales bacterium]
MAALIDASVLVAIERGALSPDTLASRYSDQDVALSAVTASELLHGVERTAGAQRQRRQAFVENLLARVPVVAFDLVAARVHASLWAALAQAGVSIGERDLLIAATAMAHGGWVVTRDRRSFPHIPGLRTDIL